MAHLRARGPAPTVGGAGLALLFEGRGALRLDRAALRAYTLRMDSPAENRTTTSDALPRAPFLWRLFVATGVPTLALLSTSDEAWERWEGATGGRIPRSTVRRLLVGTAVAHVVEAAVVHRRARSAGMTRPGRWAAATLAWGFPVMLQLRRHERF